MVNELINLDFTEGFRYWEEWGNVTNVGVPNGWSFWYRGRTEDGTEEPYEWKRPEATIYNDKWRVFCAFAKWRAVLYQTFDVTADCLLDLSAHVYQDSSSSDKTAGKIHCRVGIDPTGGTDPEADSVLWGKYESNNHAPGLYVGHEAAALSGTSVTVFLDTYNEWAMEWNVCEWNNLELEVTPAIEPEPGDLDLEERLDALEKQQVALAISLSQIIDRVRQAEYSNELIVLWLNRIKAAWAGEGE